MSVKKTGIFLLVLLVLGAFYYYYEIKRGAEREKAKAEAEKIFHLQKEKVTGFILTRGEESIRVVRQDKTWRIAEPVQAEGDYQANDQLLSTVLGATRERMLEEKNPDLEAFGLKNPSLSLTLLADNQTSETLLVGMQNPTRTGYYAMRKEEPGLFLISNFLKEGIDKSLFDLRDKTVISWATDRVTRIEIATPSLHLTVEQQGEDWQITSPLTAKADGRKIRAFLDLLRSAKVKAFVEEEPADLTPYALQPAEKRVTLFLGEDKAQKTLLFGKKDQEKGWVYAKREEKSPVFFVEPRLPESIPERVDDWRDRTVLVFDKEKITKLELASDQETVVVEKKGEERWELTQPFVARADKDKINTLLWDLYGLKVKEFITESAPDLAAYGLDTPVRRIRLWAKDQEKPLTLLIGKKAEGKEGSYARVETQGNVILLREKDVTALSKSAADLQDKRILSFETDQVARFRLTYPEKTLVLEKEKGKWRVVEPEAASSTYWKVSSLLYKIRNLSFVEKVAPSSSAADYGFDTPAVKITLWDKEGKELATLTVGKSLENQEYRYARDAAGQVYTIKADFLKALPTEVSALQG